MKLDRSLKLRKMARRPHVLLAPLTLVLIAPLAAHAQGTPLDTGFTNLQNLFTGTVAKVARQGRALAKQESDTNFAQACYDLGRINELTFQWPAALENYRQAWKLSGERDADMGFKLAHFTTGFCNHDEAIKIYEAVVRLFADPYDRAKTLINLGALYAECHRKEEAERAFLDAVRTVVPETGVTDLRLAKLGAHALTNLGIIYQEAGNSEKAQKAYSDGIEILTALSKVADRTVTTELANSLVNLADLLIDQKLYEEAERALTVSRA